MARPSPTSPAFDPGAEQRIRRLVAHVHLLGPAPVLHLLREIEGGADLVATLQRYASLDSDFVRQMGGDRWPPALHGISNGVAA